MHAKLRRLAIAAALSLLALGPVTPIACTSRGTQKTVVEQSIVATNTPAVVVKIVTATPAPTPTAGPMAQPWTSGRLEIHILDVQHGDAQLIISPSGETMMIDVGREEYASRTAEYLRQVLGELAVDYLLLTHYHGDHIQAFVPLMRDEGLRVRKTIFDRGGDRDEFDADFYYNYYDYVSDPANGLSRVRLHPGDEIDMGPDLSVKVLSVGDIDTRTACQIPIVAENDNSITLWIRIGDFDYWTGGDLSGEDGRYANIESAVIPLLPREVDVYRANHHGIDYNSNPEFVAALNPTVSLISTSTALVSWDVVVRLESFGDVYITDKIPLHDASGDILLTTTDGATYTVEGKSYSSKP
jgi:competence protein ComEC